jgi:seryl-tRNA synthetase
MLDIKYIRENADAVRSAAKLKKCPCDVDRLLEVDAERRRLQQELDALRTQSREGGELMGQMRNPKSKWYKSALESGKSDDDIRAEASAAQKELNDIKQQVKPLEERERDILVEFDQLMLTVPQPPAAEVPVGGDDTENVELRQWGEIPTFDFEPKDHVALGESLGILDIERGVKLAGSRNYTLRGDAVLLHHAVLRLALDTMIERGFEPMHIPVLVREEIMYGTGYFPGGRDQAYLCERDEMSLVGTAEVSLTALHADEILEEADLPKKFVAASPCFRREAGAAGKDTHGLYRIHLFDKVEQVVICRNDEAESIRWHEEILANAEAVVQKLELPYRVVNVCTGDLGQGQVQKFDIETWMPSRKSYGETHSASRFYEFQARRLKLRYRDADRKTRMCHTLNNTVIASPRILIPILELNQNADGSVNVPKALQPYMNGKERIVNDK